MQINDWRSAAEAAEKMQKTKDYCDGYDTAYETAYYNAYDNAYDIALNGCSLEQNFKKVLNSSKTPPDDFLSVKKKSSDYIEGFNACIKTAFNAGINARNEQL
jgi:hypothetical protein